MAIQHQKHHILHWTTPKNLLAILLFVTLTTLIQYIIITYTIPTGTIDPTATTLPTLNTTISPLYHLLPAAVIITLTTSFIHLTTQTATMLKKTQIPKKSHLRKTYQKPTRLKILRKFSGRLQRTIRKLKTQILANPTIAKIHYRIGLAKTIIRSAITITAAFIIITILITITAYPKLIPTITTNFYHWNTSFLSFVTATTKLSQTTADTIPPIGAIATVIHNVLIATAPSFRNTLEAAASTITNGLVSLNHVEKYLIIQNIAAWTVAIVTLIYSQYAKIHRYRR